MIVLIFLWGLLTAAVLIAHHRLGRRPPEPEPDPFETWLASLKDGDVFVTPLGTEIPIGRLSAGELAAFVTEIESLPETKEI